MKKPLKPSASRIGSCSLACLLALWHAPGNAAPEGGGDGGDKALQEVTVTDRAARTASLREENSAGSRLGISALETPASVQTVTTEHRFP